MSPGANRAGGARRKIADWIVGVLAPVSIALVVGAVLVSEQAGPDTELQLVAPAGARPGDRIALRANLLERLDAPDGPSLTAAPVDVTLVDAAGRVHARARLAASPAQSMEGSLVVPSALAAGRYSLIARGPSASVRAPLDVATDAPPAQVAPREVTPLAMLTLGPLVPAQPASPDAAPLPALLDVRVIGGTCVPEVPCSVLVRVGAPAADVSLTTTPSVELTPAVEPTPTPAMPLTQPDIVPFSVTVHGPEAETELVVARAGTELARRGVRLPVVLAEPQLEVSPSGLVGSSPSVRVLGAQRARPVIIDVFADGRWVYTHAFAAGALDTPRGLPGFRFERAVPHRLQARTDIFDSGAAASRYVHVARDADEEPPIDPIASPQIERRERGLVRREAAFYFASLDAERLATPVPVSGRDAAIARALVGRERVRMLSAVALVLLGALLVLLILGRGMRASREARALLLEAGDADADDAVHRRRDLLAVLAIVGAIVLACLATLVFVLARLAADVG